MSSARDDRLVTGRVAAQLLLLLVALHQRDEERLQRLFRLLAAGRKRSLQPRNVRIGNRECDRQRHKV